MSRDKQIEEMAKDIALNMQILPNPKEHPSHQMARLLFEDGYRKASDIFEEIEDIRLEHSYGEIDGNELNVKLFNLKKKYESEGEG